jgi:hypothetical protein
MRTPILTLEQQQSFKPIRYDKNYTQLAFEVEDLELVNLLGLDLLNYIQKNLLNAEIVKLLDGVEFTNMNGNTVSHKGLRYVIAYLNYSKYIAISDTSDTMTGFVQKTRTDAEVLSSGRIKILQEDNRKIALTAWEAVKEFILVSGKYPLFRYSSNTKLYTPVIKAVFKTRYK